MVDNWRERERELGGSTRSLISAIPSPQIKEARLSRVAHAYNPSYSGGKDQDRASKPARENSFETLSQKNPSQKEAGGVAQSVGPEFKLSLYKNKNNNKKKEARLTHEGKLYMETEWGEESRR
jgi:hypothetical protein